MNFASWARALNDIEMCPPYLPATTRLLPTTYRLLPTIYVGVLAGAVMFGFLNRIQSKAETVDVFPLNSSPNPSYNWTKCRKSVGFGAGCLPMDRGVPSERQEERAELLML